MLMSVGPKLEEGTSAGATETQSELWRLGVLAAGVCGLFTASTLFQIPVQVYPGWLVPLFLVLLGSIGSFTLATRPHPSPRTLVLMRDWTLVVYLLCGLFLAMFYTLTSKIYVSDEMAFAADAARLLLHGKDPYLAVMAPPSGFASGGYTPTDFGTYVRSFSYPAMGFLAYVPWLALGLRNIVWANVIYMLLVFAVFFLWSPEWLKPFGLFILALGVGLPGTVPALTDLVYVVPMLGVVRYLRSSLFAAAALFGIAASVKQTPWFIAPFLLVAVYYEYRSCTTGPWRQVLRFTGAALGTFLLINLPFILWSPAAWFHGALFPLIGHLLAVGEGLVQLSRLPFHAVTPRALFLIPVGLLFFGLAVVMRVYRRMPALVFVFPMLALLLSTRAFPYYVSFYVPPLLLALALWPGEQGEEPAAEARWPTWLLPLAVGCAGVGLMVFGTVMWIRQPLLAVARVVSVKPSTGKTPWELVLKVTNASSHPIRVNYLVSSANEVLTLWPRASLRVLPPDRATRITITEPGSPRSVDARSSRLGSWLQVTLVTSGGEQFAGPVYFIHGQS